MLAWKRWMLYTNVLGCLCPLGWYPADIMCRILHVARMWLRVKGCIFYAFHAVGIHPSMISESWLLAQQQIPTFLKEIAVPADLSNREVRCTWVLC